MHKIQDYDSVFYTTMMSLWYMRGSRIYSIVENICMTASSN